MNLFINFQTRQKFILTLRLGVLLSLWTLLATTAFASDAAVSPNGASPGPGSPFSKLQFDRNGHLYGLGPQQKSLFRIQVRKTGIATQQLFKRKHAISSFATGENGFVLISDDSAWMVDRAGKDIRRVGSEDGGGQLDHPTAIAYSKNHRIYIADSGNDRVSVFGRDGIYLFSFGNTGDRSARLKNPSAIFVDQGEKIYVVDERGNGRVNIYNSDGQGLRSLTADELQLAPFSGELKLLPVVDQEGNLMASGSDGKGLVLYDWRHNIRQRVDHVTTPEVHAIALGPDRVVTEEGGVVRSYALAESPPPTEQASILDNVTGKTIPAPSCDQANMLPAGEVLCLNRKEGSVIRYSADGRPQVRYGGALQNPSMLAWSKNRVAVVDKKGLKVFQLSGRIVYRFQQFKHLQALDFSGDRLVLISDGKQAVLNPEGSIVAQDNASSVSSISRRTRLLAIDSLQNLFTVDRRGNRVYVDNLQGGETEIISRPEISRIVGLTVDDNDQLYILAKHKEGGLYVHVYRGMLQRLSFLAGSGAAGFSVLPSADTLISVYDKPSATFRQFQYQQVPSKVIDLHAKPGAEEIAFSWLRSAEPYVSHYVVEAAVSAEGPFTEVANTKSAQLKIRLANTRYRYFRVGAVARSGIHGYPSDVLDNRFEAGYQAYRKNEYIVAIDNFRRLLLEEPENTAAMEYLGRSLIENAQYDRALDVLRQLQTHKDQSIAAKLLRTEALLRAGRFSQAEEMLRDLNNKRDNNPEQLRLCARVHLALDDNKGAQSCLNRFIAVRPNDPEARIMLLRTLDRAHQRSAINTQLNWLRNKAIKDKEPGLMASMANYFLDRGEFKDANTWFQHALKIRPNYLDARTGLIRLAENRKQFSKARSIALSMIGTTDQQVEGYRQLGIVALHQDRPGEAVLSLRKAASLEPSNMKVQLSLAKAFRQLKNFSQAKQSLSTVLLANPISAEAHFEMAQVYFADGEDRAAIGELYKVVHIHPQNIEAREMLVNALDSSGELHAATVQALILDQDKPSATHTRKVADLYYRQGRLRLALAQYRKLLRKNRNSEELNIVVGTIYHRLGQNVLARKVLEKAVRLNRRSESAQTMLAQVYGDLNLYTSALRSANTAYKLNASADNRLLLESIKSDRKEYLKNRKTGTALVIDKLVLKPVYSTALTSEKVIIGSLSVTNRASRDITDLSLRVYVGDFVDAGMVLTIPNLKAKSSENIPLKINLSSHTEEMTEDQLKHVDVELGFTDPHGSHLVEGDGILTIYGRHAADWDSSLSLQRFLQVSNNPAAQPAAPPEEIKSGETLPAYLFPLVDGYSFVSNYGIAIVPVRDSEKRYLQYPSETLARRQGSTADLGMLLSTILVSGGNRVALAGSVEHPLLLFSTGVSWEQRSNLGLKDAVLIEQDGQVWIPLALSRWPNGITAMWSAGSSLVSDSQDKVVVHELRTKPQSSANGMVGVRTNQDATWLRWYRQQQSYLLQSYLMANSAQEPEPASPLNQARWYIENKYFRHAIKSFAETLQENPYSYDALIGIGDAYDALGNAGKALNFYQRASYLEPFDKSSLDKGSRMVKQLGK
jgi:tetratricopeptide (TPR) repeat protein